jgi:ribonuclease PH
VSVGIVKGEKVLDLCYEEDSNADVDMNIIMTDKGEFIEVQGTGEEAPFSYDQFMDLISLATKGCKELYNIQREILGEEISGEIGI